MAKGNLICKYGRKPLLHFRDLKEYAGHLIKDGAELVYQAHVSAKEKVKVPYLLAEIDRLRTQLAAQRDEDQTAAKNALDLYAENESLRKYRDIAQGNLACYVHVDDHDKLRKELDLSREKLVRVSSALDKQHEEWEAFMLAYHVKSDK